MKIKQKDKVKHFSLSFILTVAIYYFIKEIIIAIIAVVILGIIKEIYDQARRKNTLLESVADTLASLAGVLGATLIIKIIF